MASQVFRTFSGETASQAQPKKVKVDNVIVEIDGDEMAHLLFKQVKNEVSLNSKVFWISKKDYLPLVMHSLSCHMWMQSWSIMT